ncbi:MAG: Gfo/Idh/MocA family oxidoreductase [Chloroflexi bacterium]|nr:Gfo/Idh/MocA family oxidoreductase [Chloroflexota bacterium]
MIGAGIVARLRHIPAFQEATRRGLAELVAICDPVPTALAEAGEQAGIEARYRDYREVLARDDIDVVTIATPNSLHEPIAVAALRSGKHVLCEKPLALSLAEARRMAKEARGADRVTAVNHRYRWVPSARYMKELLEQGEAGEVRQIFMNYFNALVVDPNAPIQWRQTRVEGGGILADIGSHLIDMAVWLLGPIQRVRGDLRTFTPERPAGGNGRATVDVDDAATCQLEFASGAVGILNVSGVCLGRGNYQRIEVYGTAGGLIYEIDWPGDAGGDRLQVCFGAAQHRTAGMAPAPTWPRHEATPLDPFLDFFQAIHDGRDPLVTFDDAVRVQAVLDAAERSAASGGVWVDVPTGI